MVRTSEAGTWSLTKLARKRNAPVVVADAVAMAVVAEAADGAATAVDAAVVAGAAAVGIAATVVIAGNGFLLFSCTSRAARVCVPSLRVPRNHCRNIPS